MAVDKWLFHQHRQGLHPPTLRFYTWSPVAISLGYHQKRYPSHWSNLTWHSKSIDLVRRPTGGRAVLHQGDLTYMVVCSGFFGHFNHVYQQICEFLIQGWRSLGVELHYGQAERGYIHHPNCFATATNADLVDQHNNKFIGSAQLRQGNNILQHGSMVLNPDNNLFEQVFNCSPPKVNLPFSHFNFETISVIIDTLIKSACQCFNIDLIYQPLSDSEWQQIKIFYDFLGIEALIL
ncbi:biotin--protein ligase [Aphanothece hegewaldii CCALA 016]|uniref:Biotin--protein ligase n=1 Tax=Aphanothece hegewaldii CCALA 016 TaxID=2107694 RepID=A0A2T1M2Z2_9CHRO|nr:biotin/lipoate A/B protein ligase family protein [Aphanothece hegewaldii]PSF39124.1 biotin--protein ligase [Aphanothece hegewaldii CCALA 016]